MKYLPIIVGIVVCLAVGMGAGALQSESLHAWYPHLVKSPLTPPDVVFPVAWTLLYILTGISVGLLWVERTPDRKALTALFAVQLAANFLWSILFFTLRKPVAGLVDISVLLALIVVYTGRAFPRNRAAAWLFVPYVAWVAFAWHLNLYVVLHNECYVTPRQAAWRKARKVKSCGFYLASAAKGGGSKSETTLFGEASFTQKK